MSIYCNALIWGILALCLMGAEAIAEPPVENSLVRPTVQPSPIWKHNYRQNTAQKAFKSGHIVSLSMIRKRIRQSFPGKIIDVRLKQTNRGKQPYIYMVKLLRKDGTLLKLRLNASNAKIISVKGNK